ncbi:hypothetical protein B0H11DRAFT_1973396 [Mycena galericulata]|nr:hypothetical protein B0H11DRAFT_1973396 [Mycena galericulata]
MRAHKGNVPSLPQTKYCSLCPAKFTRTTHLNRHLRSHTNERLHRCNLCKSSEFTRSDLLTRHKRTCGQSINRSRRKSCEACAESKIKCNLQYPCAKCTSRGRECVFQNDPEESRNKCSTSKAGSRKSPTSTKPEEACRSPTPPLSPQVRPQSPEESSRGSDSPSSLFLILPALSDSGSSESSSQSSPRSEDFNTFDEQHPFDFPFDVGTYNDPLGSTLSPFEQALFPCPAASKGNIPLSLAVDQDLDLFASLIDSPRSPLPSPYNNSLLMSRPSMKLDCLDAMDIKCLSGSSNESDQPLATYLHLFFSRFLAQVPLIHGATWKMVDTPPTLTRIFHACGALFVKTPEAAAFVSTTLLSVTTEISDQFSTVNDTSKDSDSHHVHLILALVLLQTICLFQRESGGFAPPNVQHHAMLVAMIRQTGLIRRVGSWKAPDWSDPILLEVAWLEWVQFATIKRALLLAYFHDCCHCMYSASPPAFSPAELNVHLPCDDALWGARSAAEWFAVAHTPSPYGVGTDRIYGVSMQRALTVLATPNTSASASTIDPNTNNTTSNLLPLTPFALFLLIHTVLRNICVAQRVPPPGGWSCFALVATQGSVGADFTFRTQVVLDNWLHLWLTSPEAACPAPENGAGDAQEPPFVCNSLPFYWLAQVSLWENSGSGPALMCPSPENNISFKLGIEEGHDEPNTNTPARLLEEMEVDAGLVL